MVGRLNARKVATAGPGIHPDGDGLYLCVSKLCAKTWVYRFSWHGRRPEMGIGSVADVDLAEAREARDEARRVLRSGRNPIDERRAAKTAAKSRPTFGEIAEALIEAKQSEWRNEKQREQWRNALIDSVALLRSRLVDEIDTEAVLEVLKPLWLEKPETASRLRGRIEAVLDAAKAQGHRTGENRARWRGHLSHLLPKRGKLTRRHHGAMAYAEVPAFIDRLRGHETVAAAALEVCILTATRTGEVLGASWGEIDFEARLWTVPAARRKAGREHRVPLPERAVAILEKLAKVRTCEFVFASPRGRKKLSHIAMRHVLRRMKVESVTVHGFRSSFRDWAGNETHFPHELAEAALAHVVGDKAEQAYRRSDALEKRRELMAAWASFVEPKIAAVRTKGRIER